MIKPMHLKKGDTIATVSPSFGAPSIFPHIFDNGIKFISEVLDLNVKEYPTTRMDADYLWRHPELRAKDLNDAFADPDIDAIIASIGGSDSIRILEYLDTDVILENPKIIMGFSDAAVYLSYLNQLGMVTLNGPAIMAGFSQLHHFPKGQKHISDVLFAQNQSYEYQPLDDYCHGYPDWTDESNTGKINELRTNTGWKWIQGNQKVSGRLYGGCIESFEIMKSTKYWPEEEFWNDRVLFFETSESVPSVFQVVYFLRNYGIQGIFNKIKALLIGRPRGYTDEMAEQLYKKIKDLVSIEFGCTDLIIVGDLDFGHTDPQFIMPLGIQVEIDPTTKKIKLTEPIFST